MRLGRRGGGLMTMALMAPAFLPAPAAAQTASISIDEQPECVASTFCYLPPIVTAAAGSPVSWTNDGDATHTVTRCTAVACGGTDGGSGTDANFGDSRSILPDGTFRFTFSGAGSYNYYCTIHGFPVMHGTVNVQGAGPTSSGPTAAPTTTVSGAAGITTSPATTTPAAATDVDDRSPLTIAAWLVGIGAVLGLVLFALARKRARS